MCLCVCVFTAAAVGGGQVLYMYSELDDFVMNNLRQYSGKTLVTVETADIASDKPTESSVFPRLARCGVCALTDKGMCGCTEEASTEGSSGTLSSEEANALGEWLTKVAIPKRLSKVKVCAV